MAQSSSPASKKNKRNYGEINKSPTYAQVAALSINCQLQHSNNLNTKLLEQLAEKDLQINKLLAIIDKLQNGQATNHQIATSSNSINVQSESSARSVVVTNIPEQLNDNSDADMKNMVSIVSKIDESAAVKSIKRMGKKSNGKNRPILVELRSNDDKKNVLSKARDYIKSNEILRNQKTFVNNLLSSEALKHQLELKKKLQEARQRSKETNGTEKYYIKNNKVCVYKPKLPPQDQMEASQNVSTSATLPLSSPSEAKSPNDYKIIQDFFGKPVILFYDPHSPWTLLGGYRYATQEEIEQMEK